MEVEEFIEYGLHLVLTPLSEIVSVDGLVYFNETSRQINSLSSDELDFAITTLEHLQVRDCLSGVLQTVSLRILLNGGVFMSFKYLGIYYELVVIKTCYGSSKSTLYRTGLRVGCVELQTQDNLLHDIYSFIVFTHSTYMTQIGVFSTTSDKYEMLYRDILLNFHYDTISSESLNRISELHSLGFTSDLQIIERLRSGIVRVMLAITDGKSPIGLYNIKNLELLPHHNGGIKFYIGSNSGTCFITVTELYYFNPSYCYYHIKLFINYTETVSKRVDSYYNINNTFINMLSVLGNKRLSL